MTWVPKTALAACQTHSSYKQTVNVSRGLHHRLELQGVKKTTPCLLTSHYPLTLCPSGNQAVSEEDRKHLKGGGHEVVLSPLVLGLFTSQNAPRNTMPLGYWFSAGLGGGILPPGKHSAMSRDIFGVTRYGEWGGATGIEWIGKQGCCWRSYSAQDSPAPSPVLAAPATETPKNSLA